MGLPEHYRLAERYIEAYHLVEDGVLVLAVRFLESELLRQLLAPVVLPRCAVQGRKLGKSSCK